MGLIKPIRTASFNRQTIRRWLFELCQSRSGQCLRQPPESIGKPSSRT